MRKKKDVNKQASKYVCKEVPTGNVSFHHIDRSYRQRNLNTKLYPCHALPASRRCGHHGTIHTTRVDKVRNEMTTFSHFLLPMTYRYHTIASHIKSTPLVANRHINNWLISLFFSNVLVFIHALRPYCCEAMASIDRSLFC